MLFVKTDDLKVGMRLAKPVYNKQGVLLYERESTLSAQAVSSIQNFGLIGLYILEPAEPAPPISEEEIEFERFQTIYMFRLKEVLETIEQGEIPKTLNILAETILKEFGKLNHRFPFSQNLRSGEDWNYKHSLNVAILSTMICGQLSLNHETCLAVVTAALVHDLGMEHLPQEIRCKGEMAYTDADISAIEKCLQMTIEHLKVADSSGSLPELSLRILTQTNHMFHHPRHPRQNHINWSVYSMILLVANAYDNLTAMSLSQDPISDISAIRYLKEYPDYYDTKVVDALTSSIRLIPVGSCVELSNGEKGLVLEDNEGDFMSPVVLQFSNNRVINLEDPEMAARFQIVDTMKTMDNRIKIDEESLKLFTSDARLSAQLEKIRKQRRKPVPKKRPVLR